jgi:pimeloyl-ACP methyl ester carboxylesterase
MSEELVLLPGFANNELAWTHQIDGLSDLCDVHVYIMDQESTRHEMIQSLLKEAPPRFILAGHSMGGWIAQAVAATAPERVTKLILLNTWATADPKMIFKQQQICEALKLGQLELVLQQQLYSLIHPSRHQDLPLVEHLQAMITSFPVQTLVQQLEAMLEDYPSLHHHSAIVAPTLIVHSPQDALFPDEHHALSEGIKNSQLFAIEECGHASPLEKPEIVTELIHSFIENIL